MAFIALFLGLPTGHLAAEFLETAEVRYPERYEDSFSSIAVGNGVTVAVGLRSSGVVVSRDRIHWTTIALGAANSPLSVAYGNGQFMVVGGGSVFSSVDGFSWSGPGTLDGDLTYIMFSRGRFWAVGRYGIFHTADGGGWSSKDFSSELEPSNFYGRGPGFDAIFDDGTEFHAVGYVTEKAGRWIAIHYSSSDGSNWTRQDAYLTAGRGVVKDLVTDGEVIVATVKDQYHPISDSISKLTVSEIGTGVAREIEPPIGEVHHWRGVEYRDGRFSFFFDEGIASTDSDFIAWQIDPVSSDFFATEFMTMEHLATDDGWLATVSTGHILFRSYEAQADAPWEPLYAPPDELFFRGIGFGHGHFLVLDNSYRLIRSFNGSIWSVLPGSFASADELVFVKDRFLLLDYEGAPLQSVDGTDWSVFEVADDAQIFSVAAGPDLWMALGRSGDNSPVDVYLSPDGDVWEKQDYVLSSVMGPVTYGNGIFVSQALHSSDGKTWKAHQAVGPEIRFCEGEFLSLEDRKGGPDEPQGLYRSSDGAIWIYTDEVWGGYAERIFDVIKLDAVYYALSSSPYGWIYRISASGFEWRSSPLIQVNSGPFTDSRLGLESGWGTIVSLLPTTILQSDSASYPSRLANLSARTQSGAGSATQIAGFVIGGQKPTRLLVRGIGPGLSDFNVGNPIADPMLRLMGESGEVARNENWADESRVEIETACSEVGAFQVPSGSLDAALVVELASGKYTAHVTNQVPGTGVALAEVYQLGSELPLKNLSCRTHVGSGEEAAIGGLVVSGSGIARFLVRAVGPGLSVFGVDDVLSVPVLQVYQGENLVATNQGWDSTSQAHQIASTSLAVGAFPLASGSADSALMVDLPPGNYTASVAGADGSEGIALLEIYLVE